MPATVVVWVAVERTGLTDAGGQPIYRHVCAPGQTCPKRFDEMAANGARVTRHEITASTPDDPPA